MLPAPTMYRNVRQQLIAAARTPLGVLAAASVVALFMTALRVDHWRGLVGRMLWAEDGHVFILGAMQHGPAAVLTPYAGYLHLYPRIAAWLATSLDIQLLAPLLGAAWLIAYCLTAYVCVQRLRGVGANLPTALLFLVPLGLLPTTPETLFTITNAQWYLAIGLAACALLPPREGPDRWPFLAFAALTSLTGPFCIIVLPAAVLQVLLLRNFRERQWMLVVLLVGSLIQLSFFVDSDRLAAAANRDPAAWLQGLVSFFTFGSHRRLMLLGALLFWGAAVVATVRLVVLQGLKSRQLLVAVTLFAAAGLFAVAGFYAMRDQPQVASPMGWGARYFVIPYAVALLATLVACLGTRVLLATALGAFILVGVLGYQRLNRSDLHYTRFIEFAEARGEVFVPINPQFETFRGGFQLDLPAAPGGVERRRVDPRTTTVQSCDADGKWRHAVPAAAIGCPAGTRTLGIDMRMDLPTASTAGARWASSEASGEPPLSMAYPAGASLAQFALSAPASASDDLLISVPADAGQETIKSLEFFCISGGSAH